MSSHGFERRIAGRGPVGPIPVTVHATERRKGRLGGTRVVKVHEQGWIMDLSVSGAGVVVRRIEGVVVRSPVELQHQDLRAETVVRRIVPREDGRVLYGLDFTAMDPGMREFLFSYVAARRPDDLEQHWLNAR